MLYCTVRIIGVRTRAQPYPLLCYELWNTIMLLNVRKHTRHTRTHFWIIINIDNFGIRGKTCREKNRTIIIMCFINNLTTSAPIKPVTTDKEFNMSNSKWKNRHNITTIINIINVTPVYLCYVILGLSIRQSRSLLFVNFIKMIKYTKNTVHNSDSVCHVVS